MESEIVELEHQEINDPFSSANILIHDVGKEGTVGEHIEECITLRSSCTNIINHGCCSPGPAAAAGELGEEKEEKERKGGGGHLKIDVVEEEDFKEEIICRICHMSCCSEPTNNNSMAAAAAGGSGSELIKLGCQCRGELGMSHRYCAETWFNQRANRACEICGATAKNVKVTKKPTRIWIVDFDDIRSIQANSSYGSSRRDSRFCRQSCCNLLFVCVFLCLIFPWFLRI